MFGTIAQPIVILATILTSATSHGVVERKIEAALSEQLDFLVIEVNGVPQTVRQGSEITVVKGDKLKIVDAALIAPEGEVRNVNFVGFTPDVAKRRAEDRGYVIDTANDLLPRWSENRAGVRYRVDAFSGRTRHGQIDINIIAPVMKYAVLSINGEKIYVREGNPLVVEKTDKMKLVEVATNVENANQEVEFQIHPLADAKAVAGYKFYEIHFLRAGFAFAKVPLQVREE